MSNTTGVHYCLQCQQNVPEYNGVAIHVCREQSAPQWRLYHLLRHDESEWDKAIWAAIEVLRD